MAARVANGQPEERPVHVHPLASRCGRQRLGYLEPGGGAFGPARLRPGGGAAVRGRHQRKWPNDVIYMPADCERADEYRKLCGISLEEPAGAACAWASASTCSAPRSTVRPGSQRPRVYGPAHAGPRIRAGALRVAGPGHRGAAGASRPPAGEEVISPTSSARSSRAHPRELRPLARLGFMPTLGSYEGPPSYRSRGAHRGYRRHRYLERHGHRCRRARSPPSSHPPTTHPRRLRRAPTSW